MWHCKLDVISNWCLFCERKRTEKSLSWEETTSLWAVTHRWDAHKAGRSVWVHSQRRTQGAPSSNSTPSCGGGQDLATPRLISLPPSWTGESLVHPSVFQVGDKLGLFTPEVVSKGKGDFPGQSSSLVLDLSSNHAFILQLPQKATDGWHWYSPFTLHCKGLLYQPSWNNAAFLIVFSILTEIRDLCWDFCLWHAEKFLQESRLRRQSTDEWDNSSITGGQLG